MGEVPERSGAIGEVSGRRPDDSESGSDDSIPYCQPCINVLATAFCTDCSNYFCSPCTDYHRKMALTKNHNLLEGSAMPSFYAGKPVGATARGKLNRAVVGGTAGTAMAVPLFGPIMIFKITHFEFSFPLFYYFLSF